VEHEKALTSALQDLQAKHESELQEALSKVQEERAALVQNHHEQIAAIHVEHERAFGDLKSTLLAEREGHQEALESARLQTEQLLLAEKERLRNALEELEGKHRQQRESADKNRELLVGELASHKAAAEEYLLTLSEAHNEREELVNELELLKAQLGDTRSEQAGLIQQASNRDSLVDELEKHRSVLAELQHTLQRVKDEKDAIQEEKAKQEGIMRDLQAQLARIPTIRNPPPSPTSPIRTPQERILSSYSRVNGLATKLPPPTPPPSVPPPPAPKVASSLAHQPSTSSATSSAALSPSSSHDSDINSPATSVQPSITNGHIPTLVADAELAQQLQERTKQMEEQEAIIKTLNKQLTHCEADLQSHMDMVGNLETSLGDSEKNRKF
jgi:kinesin family protein 4/21/27